MCHCAPVFRIHNTASRTRRVGIGLRPGRLSGTFSSGKCSRIRSHCSSRSFNTHTILRHYIDVRNDFEIGSSLSRGAAGVVYVGNGRQGSTAGSMVMKNLTASGTITFSGVKTGTNTDFVCMSAGGVLTLQTSACTISSLRFKENVEDMEGSAEPSINKMRVA